MLLLFSFLFSLFHMIKVGGKKKELKKVAFQKDADQKQGECLELNDDDFCGAMNSLSPLITSQDQQSFNTHHR